MSFVALSRFIGPVPLDVVMRETHESDLAITTNPVEFGADVADHAYLEPKRLVLEAIAGSRGGNAASIAAAFQALTRLQETRMPFDIVTGVTLYRNMLIERLTVTRDSFFSRVLLFTAELREVIIVDTETTSGALSKGTLAPGAAADRGSPVVQRGNAATRSVSDTRTVEAAFRAWVNR
jgi:hypothetical protein